MPSENREDVMPDSRPDPPSDADSGAAPEEELFTKPFADDEEEGALEGVEERLELLSFATGGEHYAVGVLEVREIIRDQAVTRIPRCPAYLVGVISLRGEIVPVLDLRRRLGLGGKGEEGEPMIVVVRAESESAGLLVERIVGMLQVPEAGVESTPQVVDPEKAEYFRGVVRAGDRLVTILNVERVLRIREDFDTLAGRGGAGKPGSGGDADDRT